MKFLIIFLFLQILVFSQDLFSTINQSNLSTLNLYSPDSSYDFTYIPFMDDSIKVKQEDAWGMLEIILIEVEKEKYRFLERMQRSKFLRLPPYILHQVLQILEKHENRP